MERVLNCTLDLYLVYVYNNLIYIYRPMLRNIFLKSLPTVKKGMRDTENGLSLQLHTKWTSAVLEEYSGSIREIQRVSVHVQLSADSLANILRHDSDRATDLFVVRISLFKIGQSPVFAAIKTGLHTGFDIRKSEQIYALVDDAMQFVSCSPGGYWTRTAAALTGTDRSTGY